MRQIFHFIPLLLVLLFLGCKTESDRKEHPPAKEGRTIPVEHATGFSIVDHGEFALVTVKNPWPKAERSYQYLLAEEGAHIPEDLQFDQKIILPIEKIVVTSTTHIPSLEALDEEQTLVGFPGLDYISSKNTRNRITTGRIKELGKNEALNTETLLNLNPDVVIAFAVDGSNKALNTINKSGIPVVYNSDWTERTPLGKAEWIKFFGALYSKTEKAVALFEKIERSYLTAKKMASTASKRPTVVAGAMYKDQWYLPAGESWQALFIEDANAEYLFAESQGTGSLSLSLESVLAQAQQADFWVGPAQFISYEQMRQASPHYTHFKAFQNKNIFTFSSRRGATGGVIFYELAPNRPDLVLKDLISIFHPELLPEYETTFYKPLE